jgi:broad specificity phosphatase PhoE
MVKFIPLATLAIASLAAASPTVYLIRHGEKPDSGNGLSAQGLERAQCLRSVFGASSGYNIGHIMAQTPKSGTSRFMERVSAWSSMF